MSEQPGPEEPGPVRTRERWRRPRRAVLVGGTALATLVVAGAATLGLGGGGTQSAQPRRSGPAATAVITRQDLVKTVSLAGELGYGHALPLTSTATGTVTWLPEVGTTVRRGQPLLRADERPVVLLYGFLPMYRPLNSGLTGSDVRQFERNLAALGYHGFTVDDTFSASTVDAVRHWQSDLGLPQTGTVDKDRVVYAPDAVRIAQQLVRVGASATGDVLSYTGGTRLVTVSAGAGEASWAAKGTNVTIGLPTGGSVAGRVTRVDSPTAASGAAAGPPDPASPGTGSATVEISIAVADQKALGGLSAAPVDVHYVQQERKGALTVPVEALLALAEGGYGLEVVDAGHTRILPVKAGMFADGRVEVTGDGLSEGLSVGVPS